MTDQKIIFKNYKIESIQFDFSEKIIGEEWLTHQQKKNVILNTKFKLF